MQVPAQGRVWSFLDDHHQLVQNASGCPVQSAPIRILNTSLLLDTQYSELNQPAVVWPSKRPSSSATPGHLSSPHTCDCIRRGLGAMPYAT